jgi:hypothetical protein
VKRTRLGGTLVATLLLGCAVDASLEGKRCPCADGWDCDLARNVCERKTCDPKVRVASLEPSWATAHSIHWQWQASGAEEDFLRYELWLAESRADLVARSGTARRIDEAQNPEVGHWNMPGTGDRVTSAITRGLTAAGAGGAGASPEYWAQVVVVDVAGCVSESNVIAGRTDPEPVDTIELFKDTLLPGSVLLPAVLAEHETRAGRELQYPAFDDNDEEDGCKPEAGKATCGQPLKVSGFVVDVDDDDPASGLARISNGTFPDAYLSARVRIAAPIPAVFAGLWLTVGTCTESDYQHYKLTGFVIPDGDTWVDLEVPLAALRGEHSKAQLEFDDLDRQAGGSPVCGFAVEGQWHKESLVRIDDVALRF